jgi:hypothetical protein
MVELGDIPPLLCAVAGVAARGPACDARSRHPFSELAMVNVFMATCAAERLKTEIDAKRTALRLVALVAGDGDVATG